MLRLGIASLIVAAALCVLLSGPRREFRPVVALVPVPAEMALAPPSYGPMTAYQFPADPRAPEPEMAVPKKRTSKMKTRSRKANWFAKARRQASLALSRGKSAGYDPLEDPKYSFSVTDDEEDDDDDEEEPARAGQP